MSSAKLIFLSSYSPELNPIELAFGSGMRYLRAHSRPQSAYISVPIKYRSKSSMKVNYVRF